MKPGTKPRARARDDLTCEEVITFLFEYVGGEVAPARAAAFERHLALCPSCLAYLATYRETIRLAQGALDDAVPALVELPRDLFEAILAART